MKELIKQQAAYYWEEISALHRQAKEDLESFGIKVGAIVTRNYDGNIYRITRVMDMRSEYGCYLMGLRLRRNGTYGTHEHSIDNADSVTPISQSKVQEGK